jgi:hypothetical protein
MVYVFLVNKNTRMHLPSTAWGYSVQEKLVNLGISVHLTDQEPYPDTRTEEEKARVDELLELTGL